MTPLAQTIRSGQTELAALALLLAVTRLLDRLPADSLEGLLEALTEAPHGRRA